MNLYGLLDAIIKKVNRAVKVEKQELDSSLQKQARENINVPSKNEVCNPNLLDNWYFGNPVNQRGQNEYNNSWPSIDRWNTACKIIINEKGLLVNSETENWGIHQELSFELFQGEVFTGSVFLTEVTGTVALILQEAGGNWITPLYYEITAPGVHSISGIIPSGGQLNKFNFGVLIKSGSTQIKAIKFERGGAQTLAHQDSNGNWVLNEIPNYAEELLKCRQYDPYTREYIGLRKFSQPRNLLDNSDFRNLVNQRGETTYTEHYGFDRWRIYSADTSMIQQNGYMTVTGVVIAQNLSNIDENAIYTMAAKKTDGTIYVASGTFTAGAANGGISFNSSTVAMPSIFLAAGDWVWAALYEGSYTAETLPEYQPKGYAAELAECQRYFQVIPFNSNFNMPVAVGTRFSATAARIPLVFSQEFRIPPTMTIDSTVKLNVAGGGIAKAVENSGISISTSVKNKVVINVTSSDLVSGHPVVLYGAGEQGSGIQCIRFSADL